MLPMLKLYRKCALFLKSFQDLPTPPDLDPDDPDAVEIMKIYARCLGPNARIVLLALARRLAKGAIDHGDLEPRNWTTELREEALDSMVYITIDTLHSEGRLNGA